MKLLTFLRRFAADIVSTAPRQAALSGVLMLATSLTEGLGLLLLMPLLQMVGVGDRNVLPNVTGWFSWFLERLGLTPSLGSVLVLYVVIIGARTALQKWQGQLSAAVREDYIDRMRARVYRAVAGAEWSFLVRRRPADFTHILAGEINQLGTGAAFVIDLVVTAMVCVVYMGLAFHLSARMATIVIVAAAVLGFTLRGALDGARATGARASAVRRRFAGAIAEHIGSLKTARVYGAETKHGSDFTRLSTELRDLSLESSAQENRLQQNLEFGSVVLIAVIVFVAIDVFEEPTASLLVLLFTFARLMPRITGMYRRLQTLAGLVPVLEDVTAFEGECRDAALAPVQTPLPVTFEHGLRFEAASFAYEGRGEAPALRDVDLDIPAGLTTAIVGASGSGKTTLVDLLTGLLPPSAGRVLVDGEPLVVERHAAWRALVGYVPQETFLFHDTIRANLLWGSPGASDADIWRALQLAAAADFVAALPEGLETQVGERGVMVSGGERQRLSLARALLRRPKVLVLDEATSSLDAETERRIQGAIESLHREMTIVIVTHRLSVAASADVIHVMEGGRVQESGSWDVLSSRRGGRFRALCDAQGLHTRPEPVRPLPAAQS